MKHLVPDRMPALRDVRPGEQTRRLCSRIARRLGIRGTAGLPRRSFAGPNDAGVSSSHISPSSCTPAIGPFTGSYVPRGGHTGGVPSSGLFRSASSAIDECSTKA